MSALSIAYLCADRGIPIGGTKGASIHVRGVAEALHRRGHHVRIVAARTRPEAQSLSVEVKEIVLDRIWKAVRRSIDGAESEAQLARELNGLILNEASMRALDHAHAQAPIEALYERYSLWSWAGYRFAREHGVPWILEVNAPLVREQKTYRGLSLDPVASGIQNYLLRKADAIAVPSAELRDFVYGEVGERSGVVVMPNAVDMEVIDSPRSLPAIAVEALQGRYVIAFSGSLKPWHGVDRLLRVFERLLKRVSDAHLLLIGDGPLGPDVERAVKRLGTDRITWTRAIPHEDVPLWLRHADVGVAPYPEIEDFYFSPLKIVEYLAVGLPVVASNLGQIPELVQDGETGLLVAPGDGASLLQALARLHEDRRLRKSMGRRASERARRNHDWAGVAEKLEKLFSRRLHATSEPSP